MAYETGSVASGTALLAVIENFAILQGYTLNAGTGSWLSKGGTSIQLSATSTTCSAKIANTPTGPDAAPGVSQGISIALASWPIKYELFYSSIPNLFVCVLTYDTLTIQILMFGELVKINNAAYTGGNFLYGSGLSNDTLSSPGSIALSLSTNFTGDGLISGSGPSNSPRKAVIPFTKGGLNSSFGARGSALLHVEIDGDIINGDIMGVNNNVLLMTQYQNMLFYSPNIYNSQAILIPIHLQKDLSAGNSMYLGYVEHIRFIRITNYEIGDVITLGSDKWKVYPWRRKSAVPAGNGAFTAEGDTSTIGFAVRFVQ